MPLIDISEYEVQAEPVPVPKPKPDIIYLVVAWSESGGYWKVHRDSMHDQHCESDDSKRFTEGTARERAIAAAKKLAVQWTHRGIVRLPVGPRADASAGHPATVGIGGGEQAASDTATEARNLLRPTPKEHNAAD
jgi:hypothetical protein